MKRPAIFLTLTFLLAAALFVFVSQIGPAAPAADRTFENRQAAAMRSPQGADTTLLESAPRYHITAQIDPDSATVTGSLRLEFTNPGDQPLDELVFRLYPNASSIYGGGGLEVTHAATGDAGSGPGVESPGVANKSADAIGDSSVESLGVANKSADAIGDSSVESPGVANKSADAIGDSSVESLGVANKSADAIGDSSVETPGFLNDPTILRLPLAEPLAPGARTEARLDFTAHIPELTSLGYGIFARSTHVIALAGWYPILAPYSLEDGWLTPRVPLVGDALQADVSFYEVSLTLPAGYQVASSGSLLTDNTPETGSTPAATLPAEGRTPGFAPTQMGEHPSFLRAGSGSPLKLDYASGPAREFALALSPSFTTLETQVGEVTLRLHTLPEAGAPATPAEQALEQLATAFRIFEELYGPYPYREFEVVEAPISIGGYEFSGMVIVDDHLRQSGAPASYEYILAHELAHQWWYGLAGTPTVAEPWLDEAHATYAAAVYLERAAVTAGRAAPADGGTPGIPATGGEGAGGSSDSSAGVSGAAAALIAGWEGESGGLTGPGAAINQPAGDFQDWDAYRKVVYSRGALFLHALRQELGDAAFFALERGFLEQYRFQAAATGDYLDLARQAAGGQAIEGLVGEYFR